MAVEVRIPTILRTYTGGAKSVEGDGATLLQVIDDVECRHPGLKDADRRRRRAAPVRERLRQRRGRPVHRWPAAPTADGDVVVVLPGRRRRLIVGGPVRVDGRLGRSHPAHRPAQALAERVRPAVGQARGPQPHRLDQGPGGAQHDPGRGGRRHPAPGRHHPRTDQRQHRHLARHGGQTGRLPADLRDAGEHLDRTQADPRHVGGGDRLLAGRRRLQPGRRASPRSSPPSIRTG